jgi:hypothetical protein
MPPPRAHPEWIPSRLGHGLVWRPQDGRGETMTSEEIKNRVCYHSPSFDGINKHAELSKNFADLMQLIEIIVPDGREKALAFTKLEEAKMWASAGVARNPDTR